MMLVLHKFRYFFLVSTLIGCIFLWPGVKSAIVVDNSLTVWFMEDDPALMAYQDFQQRFGNDEVVILMVKDNKTLLTSHYFDKFVELTKALENIPEVASVVGPGNAVVASKGIMGVKIKPLLSEDVTPEEVKERLGNMPILREQLFNEDHTTARFLIVLKSLPNFDARRGEILDKVKSTVYTHLPQERTYFGGVGIIFVALNALSQQDFGFFLGVAYLMMFVLILIIYRQSILLLYTLGTVALSTYVTLGIYGLLGFQLNMMTSLLPVIITLLGMMDVLHVLNEQNQLKGSQSSRKENALVALGKVFKPCLFTSLTTMAGFLALLASPMAILQNFGTFSAVGILLSLLFTYLLGVILLPHSKPSEALSFATGSYLEKLSIKVGNSKKKVFVYSFALLMLGVVGITLINVDTYTLNYLPADHQVRQDHVKMEESWGPYMPLELLVQVKEGQRLDSPEMIRATVAFADSVKTISGLGSVFGYHSLYQAGLQSLFPKNSKQMLNSNYALTEASKQLKQNYPDLVNQFMHNASQTGRITVFGEMPSVNELTAKMDTIMQVSKATFGDLATVTPSGYQPMYANIEHYVTSSQIYSLMLALVFVFVLVWMFLRNLKLAILSVLPNLFPIILMLGFMGWMDISLDIATASIAAFVLSFCIDDTIHFVYSYQRYRKAGASAFAARQNTMKHVGPAIVLTSAILFFGYALMIFGELKTVILFGLLTSLAIVGALYSQLVIFPLLLEIFDKDKVTEETASR